MGALSQLRLLVVDDEVLACQRLEQLLHDNDLPHVHCLTDSRQALTWLTEHRVDILLADISMPGLTGIELARQLRQQAQAPQLIFTTAYDHFAVEAFELDAADYLLKPIRRERLQQALQRAARRCSEQLSPEPGLSVRQGDRLLTIPYSQIRYFKAELKYVTLITVHAEYLLDDSLSDLEQQLADKVVRIHRNCLVMRHAIRELHRQHQEQWQLRLHDIDTPLPVSRRQQATLKALLQAGVSS
ncbi:LytTR family DNA-binding domain-containing protein [Neisseriaceae bacterium TC5R-5]|nr:LytTR family DNA-binding domain-containing protein [Neisseriaceae bacterium TC5R-5]